MEGKFYITTPIYYINDKPHIGHAYATIIADVIARSRRLHGEDALLSTGVDENAQKTVDAAKKSGEEIHAYVERMAGIWESTWQKMGISYTDFIRTTEPRHVETVNDIWTRMDAAGDLYRGKYEGLYCKGHEAFMNEDELVDGLCPDHKTAPEFVSEENYYFKLSNYQQKLLDFYAENPDFVAPANRFNEVKSFVERGLEDISFSREHKEWGIPVPKDPSQVIYVWADALVNYISSVGIEGWEEHPADIHVVGKDITRFHAVIWPAMLMSAGLPLPGQILAHGFFTIADAKISKSLGNTIDPLDLTAKYGNDAVRYFLLREIPFGEDGDFSEEKMKERYNGDLANGLGNFASRVLALGVGLTEPQEIDSDIEKKIAETRAAVEAKINEFKLHEALHAIWDLIRFGDKYVNDHKVWAIEDESKKKQAIFNLIVILDNVGAMLLPFLPETSAKITACISWTDHTLVIKKSEGLFPRLK